MTAITSGRLQLNLLGGFELKCEFESMAVPLGTQRLLALLALEDEGIHRSAAGELLWPERPCSRASANLRSALWGGKRIAARGSSIECVSGRLRLAPWVRVDVRELMQAANQIDDQSVEQHGIRETLVAALRRELLTDWSDDWILFHRERWDEIRLHALESLAEKLRAEKQYSAALQTALTAASIDLVRETPYRIVIEVHIAEGNFARALNCYQRYRVLLQRELGVSPSPRMSSLVRELLST